MPIERAEFPKVAKASIAFYLCWLSGFVVSYVWVYSRWRLPSNHLSVFFENQMWFYDQEVLPHGFYARDAAGYTHEVVSAPITIILSILVWLIVGFIFGWFTRRLRLYFTIPLAVIAIYAVLIIASGLFYVFGVEPYMDGP